MIVDRCKMTDDRNNSVNLRAVVPPWFKIKMKVYCCQLTENLCAPSRLRALAANNRCWLTDDSWWLIVGGC